MPSSGRACEHQPCGKRAPPIVDNQWTHTVGVVVTATVPRRLRVSSTLVRAADTGGTAATLMVYAVDVSTPLMFASSAARCDLYVPGYGVFSTPRRMAWSRGIRRRRRSGTINVGLR